MASLTGKKIKDTYKGIIKTSDNAELSGTAKELTDGNGNGSGVYLDNAGNVSATSFTGDGSGLTNLPSDAVSSVNTQTGAVVLDTDDIGEGSTNQYFTTVRAVNAVTGGNLDMGSYDITTTGKIYFANVFSTEGDLPSASTYHGMFAHVHATGKAYFAHGGSWHKLLDEDSSNTDDLSEGSTNLYYTDARVSANTDVVANTAKTGITTAQANEITANTAKVGITPTQASEIAANTLKTGITAQQASDISANNLKVGITTQQADDIVANNAKNSYPTADATKLAGVESGAEVNVQANWNETDTNSDAFIQNKPSIPSVPVTSVNTETGDVVLDTDDISEGTSNLYYTDARVSANASVAANTSKTGITAQQTADILTNNSKVGITTSQADEITANTAKNSYPSADASKLAGIEAGAEVNPTSTDELSEGSSNLYYTESRVSSNTSVAANTSKNTYPSADASKLAGIEAGAEVNPTSTDELAEGSNNLYYTESRVSANTNVAANTAKNSYPTADANKLSGIEAGAEVNPTSTDELSEGSTNLYYTEARVSSNTSVAANTAKNSYPSADSTKLAGIEASADVTDAANVTAGLVAATNISASDKSSILANIGAGTGSGAVDSVNGATGVVVLDTDDISEGTTNLYYTDARADARVNLQTGSNLDLSNKSTSDLSEGTNLYFTDARVSANSSVSANTAKNSYPTADANKLSGIEAGAEVNPTNTDGLSEGSSNLYYTEARVSANTNVVANTAKISFDSASSTKLSGIEAGAEVNTVDSVNGATGAVSLDTADLTDVSATAPSNGQVLQYNSTSSNYEPVTLSSTAPVDSVNSQTGVVVLDADDISDAATTNKFTTAANLTKLGNISVSQAVDLDTMESDIATNNAKNTYPSADATKVGHISVTQAVDLDTMESNIATNNAKNSYPSADATKVGHISVTQAVDLDTIESNVATNNAKISFDSTSSTKLGTIEENADVTDTANVTAAGALMDSEVVNLAQVKAFDSSDYATAAQGTKADAALPEADVDADIKTLSLPANTTISTFAKTILDDADASAVRTTIGAGTSNLALGTTSTTALAGDTTTISASQTNAIIANTAKNSYPSADATKVGHISVTQAVDLDTMESNIATNNSKVSNVTTNLTTSTTTTSVTVNSSDGTNATIGEATGSAAGVMSTTHHNKLDGIAANATNVTNNNQLTNGAGYTTNTGTVTSVSSSTTNQLTVATGTSTPALSVVTGTVADAGTALATGDQIHTFVTGQGYITGNETVTLSGDITGSGTTAITASIANNVVGADELNVSGNGTSGQVLASDGDGTFSWANAGGGNEFASGLYIGGTAAANLLEDYEKGTWTPTVTKSYTGAYAGGGSHYGYYERVGDFATVVFVVELKGGMSGSTTWTLTSITNLPFQATPQTGIEYGYITLNNGDSNTNDYGARIGYNSSITYFYDNGSATQSHTVPAMQNRYITGRVTYKTS